MKLKYCMYCAARLNRRSNTLYICTHGHEYYNNPKAAVSVVLMNISGMILYAKRAHEPKKDHYDLPGGFLNFNENARAAARRFVYLETGLALLELKLLDTSLAIHDDEVAASSYVFLCTRWSGESSPAEDVASLEWKSLEFIKNKKFAWEYPDLYETLKPMAEKLAKKRLLM